MTERILLVVLAALFILWGSDTITIKDGALINRAGLWQRITGQPMVISFGPQRATLQMGSVTLPISPMVSPLMPPQYNNVAPPTIIYVPVLQPRGYYSGGMSQIVSPVMPSTAITPMTSTLNDDYYRRRCRDGWSQYC